MHILCVCDSLWFVHAQVCVCVCMSVCAHSYVCVCVVVFFYPSGDLNLNTNSFGLVSLWGPKVSPNG